MKIKSLIFIYIFLINTGKFVIAETLNTERTFSMIKSKAVTDGKERKIQQFYKDNGFKIIAAKKIILSEEDAKKLYKVHETKHFYDDLKNSNVNKEVVVQILEAPNAIERNRNLMGNADPKKAQDGTIRKIFGDDMTNNAVHGSDSNESAQYETNIFFNETEYKNNK